jgi:hypothetical protein
VSDLANFYVIDDLEILHEEIDRILSLEYRLPTDLSSELKRLRTSISNILSATRTDSNSAFSRPTQLPTRIDERWLDSSGS